MQQETTQSLSLAEPVRRGRQLARHVWRHFAEDRCLEEAASLAYTSLLALVPLFAVIFGVIAAFPMFNDWSEQIQDFIFKNFMPATGEQILPYIEGFLGSITSLTVPGMVVLIITALMLMVRIDLALNRIWRVSQARTLINRIVMYWAVLTLGPLLIGAAVAISAHKVFMAFGLAGGLSPLAHQFGIFLLSWVVIAMVFLLVPNRRVRFTHALIGAFLSAFLFALAKGGFVAYVSNTNYRVIYGALATIPIFLFWMYLVWIVILLGASLAASLTTFLDHTRKQGEWPEVARFQLAFRLVGHLWQAQKEGRSLDHDQLLDCELQATELELWNLTGRLQESGVISRQEDGSWMLARDLGEFSLADLHRKLELFVPLSEPESLPNEDAWDEAFVTSLAAARDAGRSSWGQPLRELYPPLEQGKPS